MLSAATSSTFSALIWWVVPLIGVISAFGYVLWISRYQRRFENETHRSVGSFKKFQDSFQRPQDPPQQ
jgi:type II secretory pathway component PulF